jgi:hypothetical protein
MLSFPQVAPSESATFCPVFCEAERNSAGGQFLVEPQLFPNGRGGIADLVDGLLKVFPRYVEMPGPVPDFVRLLHIDLAAIWRFFPGEAAHIGILPVNVTARNLDCQDKAHFKRNNFKSKKSSSAFSGDRCAGAGKMVSSGTPFA